MSDVFELEHIFIVFTPGTGGNFLAGIIKKLLEKDFSSIEVSNLGSSHTVINNKINGTNYMSFGTIIQEHYQFESDLIREHFFLEKIKSLDSDIKTPQVVWSHDYTNIPLYRKYFKNSKIIVITHDTNKERLISLFMQIKKVVMNKDAIVPISKSIFNKAVERMMVGCKRTLSAMTSDVQKVNNILEDPDNVDNNQLILYAIMRINLKYNGMLDLVNDPIGGEIMVYDHILYPPGLNSSEPDMPKVGKLIKHYIDEKCVILPYRYLIYNDVNLLIEIIEQLFEKTLDVEEIIFIKNNFLKYYQAQDKDLMTDPIKYYHNIKKSAYELIQ